MPSPFPGMDPYLEGHLWPDVHNALAYNIRQQLVPQLQPRSTARLETYVVQDTEPETEIGMLYPDSVPDPNVLDLISWPDRCGLGDDPDAEAIVDRALSYRPIEL